jgi:hypothetical protein
MSLSPGARIQLISPAIITFLATVTGLGVVSILAAEYPPQLGDLQWRLSFLRTIFADAPQVALLLLLIMLTGVHSGLLRPVRLAGIVSLLLAVCLVPASGLFVLDTLTGRRLQPQSVIARYTHENLALALTSLVLAVVLALLGWRALKATEVITDQRKALGGDLVVAQGDSPK